MSTDNHAQESEQRGEAATLRAELARSIQENAALREEKNQIQEDRLRLHEQLADARREIDELREEKEELREKHEEEHHELAEEMKAAWTFESAELRSEIERLKAEVGYLTGERATLTRHVDRLMEYARPFLLAEEEKDFEAIVREEGAEREKVHLAIIREHCMPIYTKDAEAQGTALFNLYKYMRNKSISDAVASRQLSLEIGLRDLRFNIKGMKRWWNDAAEIPLDDMVPFALAVICPLPALKSLAFAFLPSMRECVLPLLDRLPPTLRGLGVPKTPFTVDDIITIAQQCKSLRELTITYNCCSDWGGFTEIRRMERRKDDVNRVCRGIIRWK